MDFQETGDVEKNRKNEDGHDVESNLSSFCPVKQSLKDWGTIFHGATFGKEFVRHFFT